MLEVQLLTIVLTGAPEASRTYEEEERDVKQVHVASDIWSLGCVVSDSITWVSGGMAALEIALIDRNAEIKEFHSAIIGSGHEQGFHNGSVLLNCVLNAHITALENLQDVSSLSEGVRRLVEGGMLVPIEKRHEPMFLWNQFDRLYKELSAGTLPNSKHQAPQNPYHSSASQCQSTEVHSKEGRYSQRKSSILGDGNGGHSAIPHRYSATSTVGQNGFHSPVSAQVTPLGSPASGLLSPSSTPTKTTSMYGTTTVDDAFRHRQNNGRRETLDGYLKFRRRMTPRHFIILIDDSESMRIMFREVLKVVEVLVWLVKDFDSLGVDVRFASNPTKRHTRTFPRPSTDKLMAPIRQWFDKNDADRYCNMKYLLNKIFADDKIVNPKHPTSVLVLTDGVWEGGPIQDSGVEESISQVIQQMNEKGVRDTDFTFQFVRFGNNPDGLARLKYLDDEAVFESSKRHKV
jgi:hypothetical protein